MNSSNQSSPLRWKPPSKADKLAFYKQEQLEILKQRYGKRSFLTTKLIEFTVENYSFLSTWEHSFVQSLNKTNVGLSVKQAAILRRIAENVTQQLILYKKREQQEWRISGERT